MFSFKEWLVLESIRTEIMLPLQAKMFGEQVLEEFLRQFFESTRDSYYKDQELDCRHCGHHGFFQDKSGGVLECPECKKSVSDSDIRECENCKYTGEFNDKEEGYACPKCGKIEVVEIPDPFADGDEDAEPKSIDKDAIEKERKEAEEAKADAAAEEERKKRSTKGETTEELSPEQKEFATRLRNNSMWVRWHSMAQRKKDIERLKEISSKLIKVSESFDLFADDEEVEQDKSANISRSELAEAEEILMRLGYMKKDQYMDESEKERKIIALIQKAANEKGNDLPSDIEESEVLRPQLNKQGQPELDKWGRAKMIPSEKVQSAKDQLISDLTGLSPESPNTFRNAFQSVVRSNTSFRGTKEPGHQHFSDPEEVANAFVVSIIDMLTNRKVGGKGEAKSWGALHSDHGDFGSSGKEDLSTDKMLDQLVGAWKNRIYSLLKSAEHKRSSTLSPSGQRPDEVKQRTEVNSRMNKDIKAAKVALYAKSLLSSGSSKSEVAERLGVTEQEVENMDKNPLSSLQFHIDYLKAVRNGTEKQIVPNTKDDKYRLELMNQIVIRSSSRNDISLDPENILKTIEAYRDNYSTKGRAKPIFAGQVGGDEGGKSDELSSGLEALAKARSDDETPDRPGVFAGSSVNTTPAAIAISQERRRRLLQYIYEALNALNAKGIASSKSANKTKEFWQILAICIKLGLPYDNKTGRWKPTPISDEIVDAFYAQSVEKVGDDKCFRQLSSIGDISLQDMWKRMREITLRINGPEKPPKGGDISYATAWQWLGDGLKFVCDHIKQKSSEEV